VAQITSGTQARMTVPERPGHTYTATVESTSESVDPASGTTLVQLAVDNAAGELLPGAFANVRFDLRGTSSLSVPASAVIVDSSGVRVATIGPNNRVALKTVTVARDLGSAIEIGSGLTATDRIIDSPPDGIGTGDRVRIAPGSTSEGMLAVSPSPAPATPAAGAGRRAP
jgi:multidrug efflux pump subunit AcrA (membrane-fusion protein)